MFLEGWEAQDRVSRAEVLLLLWCREGYAQQSALFFSLDHKMMIPLRQRFERSSIHCSEIIFLTSGGLTEDRGRGKNLTL